MPKEKTLTLRAPLVLLGLAFLQLGCGLTVHAQEKPFLKLASTLPVPKAALAVPTDSAAAIHPLGASLSALKFLNADALEVLVVRQQKTPAEALSLAEALKTVIVRSHALGASRARTEASRYQADAAMGSLLPQLDVRAGTGRETSSPSSVIDAGTGLAQDSNSHDRREKYAIFSQALFDWSAINDWRRAKASSQAELASFDGVQEDVAYELLTNYLELVQGALNLKLAEERVERLRRLMSWIEMRYTLGGASGADRDRVKGRMLNAEAYVSEAWGNLEQTSLKYQRLTGLSPALLRLPVEDAASPALSLDEALNLALRDNYAVRTAKLNVDAAVLEKESQRGKFFPRVALEFSDNRALNVGGAPGWQKDARGMVVMTMPLINGGTDYHNLQAASARQIEYTHTLRDAEQKLEQSLRIAYNGLTTANSKLKLSRAECEANRRVADAYDEQLRAGGRTLLDTLDAYERLYVASSELLRLGVTTALLHYQVLRAVGQLNVRLLSRAGAESRVVN